MTRDEYEATKAQLSARGQKMLARIEKGRFYHAFSVEPATMAELKRLGLVNVCGRVAVITACYVPAWGYTPYVRERFAEGDAP